MKKKYSALALSLIIAISSIATSIIKPKVNSPQPTKTTIIYADDVDPEREYVD